jgi:hypothetical protein
VCVGVCVCVCLCVCGCCVCVCVGVCVCVCVCMYGFFFNFDLLHVPLLEVILHALFHIYSYNTMLSSSSYILLHTVMA